MGAHAASGCPEGAELGSAAYASFILRCFVGERRVWARLVDVETGVTHTVKDLSLLPALLGGILKENPEDAERQ